MAPLEARVFATLVITGKEGITFEQLVKDLNASKSTICTHLNTLQTAGRIKYHTRPGDRKRYFTVTPDRLLRVMDEMLQNWNEQHEIHQEILNYKIQKQAEQPVQEQKNYDLDFHEDYLEFLEEVSKSVEKLKQNISKKSA